VTVTNTEQVVNRLFSGYPDDPSLPLGTWVVRNEVTGDASGGSRQAIIQFDPGSTSLPGLYFSLEELTVLDADNNAKVGDLRTVNLETVGGTEFTRFWRANLVAAQSFAVLEGTTQNALRKLYMGATGVAGAPSGITYSTTNVDLNALAVIAGGYYWGVRSINSIGGPSRPFQGLYPN